MKATEKFLRDKLTDITVEKLEHGIDGLNKVCSELKSKNPNLKLSIKSIRLIQSELMRLIDMSKRIKNA